MRNNLLPMTYKEKAIGWPYLVIQLFFLPTILGFLNYALKLKLSDALLNAALFCLDSIFVMLIFHRFLRSELQRAIEEFPQCLFVGFAGYILYMLELYGVNYSVAMLQPEHINANNAVIQSFVSQHYILMVIGTVLLVPITEETLFRGLIFGTLYRKNPILGYVLSTLIFAAIHVVSYIGMQDIPTLLLSLMQYIPAGLTLSWAYVRSGTICTPILIHAVINLIGISAMR